VGRILFPNPGFPQEIKTCEIWNNWRDLAVWISETRPEAARAPWIKLNLAPLHYFWLSGGTPGETAIQSKLRRKS
jgi:hypothetical protein